MTACFADLRRLLLAAAPGMVIGIDTPGYFDLIDRTNPKVPHWFAGVRLDDRQVSLHLMPLCRDSRIAAQIPEILHPCRVDETRFVFGRIGFEEMAALDRLFRVCVAK